jgi:hypothetical protein
VRRWSTILAAAAAMLAAEESAAQSIVASPGPDSVAVTIYRDPNRQPGDQPDLQWLNGYALISETRHVRLPAGESTIRFEGVAGGIIPQSAIVSGFPEDIVERNRDAFLLSPATLLDASLGRRVHLRRISNATGQVREHDAIVRSGAGGAVVLQTLDGFEALRCTGLRETAIYDSVPPGLAARPTLSVRARSRQAVDANVTLSYLATGFDWQANYIATLSDDRRRIELFAWLTLASTDETSFVDASTLAVAGVVNWQSVRAQPREGPPLQLHCWPQQMTSDIPLDMQDRLDRLPAAYAQSETIFVTGSRVRRANLDSTTPVTVVTAEQEDLGDLKLYRIPIPVTVAANSQKQVALLQQPRVDVDFVYRRVLDPETAAGEPPEPAQRFLTARNREREGLGIPLPGGRMALFAVDDDRPVLLGEGQLSDRAIGEEVEIEFGPATAIFSSVELVREGRGWAEYRLTVTNDSEHPIRFEAQLLGDAALLRPRRLEQRDGWPLWTVRVPASGSASLVVRVRDERTARLRPASPAADGGSRPGRRR